VPSHTCLDSCLGLTCLFPAVPSSQITTAETAATERTRQSGPAGAIRSWDSPARIPAGAAGASVRLSDLDGAREGKRLFAASPLSLATSGASVPRARGRVETAGSRSSRRSAISVGLASRRGCPLAFDEHASEDLARG
jgi:hypothetical protein